MARTIRIPIVCFLVVLSNARRDESKFKTSDEEVMGGELELHSEYYAQVFRPHFSRGEDHRLSHVVTESLAEVSEHVVQTAVLNKEEECGVCVWAVRYIIARCCMAVSGKFVCDPHSPSCEDGLSFVDMRGSFLQGQQTKDNKVAWRQTLYRVWSDLSALGQLLKLWEIQNPSDSEADVGAAIRLCQQAMTETFDCLGDVSNNGCLQPSEQRLEKLPNSAVKIEDHRKTQCAGVHCRGYKVPEDWKTHSFCNDVQDPSVVLIELPAPEQDKHRVHLPDAGTEEAEEHETEVDEGGQIPLEAETEEAEAEILALETEEASAASDEGLGFPEIKLVWSDATWVSSQNQPDQLTSKCLEKIKGQQDLAAFLSKEEMSSKMIRKMCIFLRDTNGNWFLEKVPSKVALLLKGIYNGEKSKMGRFGHVLKKVLNVQGMLQDICFAEGKVIARSSDTVVAYENTDKGVLRKQIERYVGDYGVNLEEVRGLESCQEREACIDEAVSTFTTYNQFFSRKLSNGARHFLCYSRKATECKTNHLGLWPEQTVVSPADARVIAFEDFRQSLRPQDETPATGIWVKGEQFALENLVKFKRDSDYKYYDGGTVLLARLAPQDYHRFHFPVDGKVTSFEHYPGNYYSVNPIAVHSTSEPVFTTNKRMHVTISSGEENFGCVTYISVGATNVASIRHTSYVGQEVLRGMEHGFMAFGGSTVIVVLRAGVMDLRDVVKEMSAIPVETIVRMGEHLGTRAKNHTTPPAGSTSPCD